MKAIKFDEKEVTLLLIKSCKTMKEVAAESGIDYQTLRRAMRGGAVRPSTAGRIAKALGISITELIEN